MTVQNYDAIMLLCFVTFFGCIVIGWSLAAFSLHNDDESCEDCEK